MQENTDQMTLAEEAIASARTFTRTIYQEASWLSVRTRPKPQFFQNRMGHFHSWRQEHLPDEMFQGKDWQFIVDHSYTWKSISDGVIDLNFHELKLILVYDNIHDELIYWMRHGTVLLRPVFTYKKFRFNKKGDEREHNFVDTISVFNKSGQRKKHLNFETKQLIDQASKNRKFWEEHQ